MTTFILMGSAAVMAATLADGARSDLCAFRINNRVPLVLAASWAAAAAAGLDNGAWGAHLAAAGLMLALGAAAFAVGLWGGGDAKMLPAVALWVGLADLPRFLLVMALGGGVLALLALAARRLPTLARGPIGRMAATGHLPYGVAIAVAGLDWWLASLLPQLQLAIGMGR